ncbi:autotransporter [Synergistales bacterium]|nr:autotransporter [Synergistales bacterium]GHV53879.1 autotransporter [Synergistales bacterium]
MKFRINFLKGARTAIPIMMGYVPAGFACGVLAQQAGMSVLEVFIMSAIVYTGTSQFITIAQLSAGVSYGMMVLTCGIVNLRYALMSASVAAKFSRLPFLYKVLFGMEISDETFMVNAARSEAASAEELARPPLIYETLGVTVMSHATWIAATASGCFFGSVIGDAGRFGIDFGLVAVFLALLAPRLKDKKQFLVIIMSGAVAAVSFLMGFGTWSIIIATVAGAALGAGLK